MLKRNSDVSFKAKREVARKLSDTGKQIKVAFISYWGINDPLCTSTVLPHVRILEEMEIVERVHLYTFEREAPRKPRDEHHYPVYQKRLPMGGNFLFSYLRVIVQLALNHSRNQYDLVICRSIFAGIVGFLMWLAIRIPYVVESYEPHADYMVDNGVWKKKGWKARVIGIGERLVEKTAFKLLTVSSNFRSALLGRGVESTRIGTLPCTVDTEMFRYDSESRMARRVELGIAETDFLGIYVGKLGDMYLSDEVGPLLMAILESQKNVQFLFLTDPDNPAMARLLSSKSIGQRIQARLVAHENVASYLSAADFALVLTRPTATSQYLSPIKIGEYLASGLPIVIPESIGDDSAVIARENLGLVVSWREGQWRISHLDAFWPLTEQRRHIAAVGKQLRGRHLAVQAYERLGEELLKSRTSP